MEDEFRDLWSKFGVKGYSFDKFRFEIDMSSGHHYHRIMGITTPNGTFDLEQIAEKYPLEKRTAFFLDNLGEYRETTKKIKEGLNNIGFGDWNLPNEIKEFFNHQGILPPHVEYFYIED